MNGNRWQALFAGITLVLIVAGFVWSAGQWKAESEALQAKVESESARLEAASRVRAAHLEERMNNELLEVRERMSRHEARMTDGDALTRDVVIDLERRVSKIEGQHEPHPTDPDARP